MANSLLLLSQTQAKSALALKRIVRQQPTPHNSNASDPKHPRSKILTQKDRLRAAVRGALVTRNEEEMSDSAFLGKATKGPMTTTGSSQVVDTSAKSTAAPSISNTMSAPNSGASHNPVDDMYVLAQCVSTLRIDITVCVSRFFSHSLCLLGFVICVGWNWNENCEIWIWLWKWNTKSSEKLHHWS